MKKQYEYEVGGIKTSTRRTARELQRAFRAVTKDAELWAGAEPVADVFKTVPKIIQKLTMERVIR